MKERKNEIMRKNANNLELVLLLHKNRAINKCSNNEITSIIFLSSLSSSLCASRMKNARFIEKQWRLFGFCSVFFFSFIRRRCVLQIDVCYEIEKKKEKQN